MSTTIDLDTAKDRVSETLSNARSVTKTAVRDDIAPAVAAAVNAALDASAPLRAEAANRAGDAVDALRKSDVAERARVAAGRPSRKPGKRRFVLLGVAALGAGAAAFKVLKGGKSSAPSSIGSYPVAPPPTTTPAPVVDRNTSPT